MRNPESQQRGNDAIRTALRKLHSYLVDPTVVELLLNPDGSVWVERLGAPPLEADVRMTALEAENMLRQVAAEVRAQLNATEPSMLCRLPIYGARLQALIPPIVEAPVFAIRRPAGQLFPLSHYVEQGVLTEQQRQCLRDCVRGRDNILVGGSTGSGKTTFATSLLNELCDTDERVLIIEDYPELQCTVRHKVPLLINPPSYTWRRAVINAMRLRPDRIIVAEVVDGAAVEVEKAWKSGHPGIATIHADSPALMLERFCQLMEEVVPYAPRVSVAQTINVCVHLRRDRSHPAGRVVTGIVRVKGYDREAQQWLLEDLSGRRRAACPYCSLSGDSLRAPCEMASQPVRLLLEALATAAREGASPDEQEALFRHVHGRQLSALSAEPQTHAPALRTL
jgi:P-type conjugative transfer ATPase TrbB